MARKKQKFDLVTQGQESSFTDVGKSETAGRKYNGAVDLPDHDGVDGQDSRFVYCKQCGFLIDTTEVTEGNPWGNHLSTFKDKSEDADDDLADTTVDTDYPTYPDEPTGGCPHCHSSEWR